MMNPFNLIAISFIFFSLNSVIMALPSNDRSVSSANLQKLETISFTLRNNSSKSIPLIIPGVMNPNLSPFSNSGVSLKVGQEIFFRLKGRKVLLLKVSDEIKNAEIIEVSTLIKKRKE